MNQLWTGLDRAPGAPRAGALTWVSVGPRLPRALPGDGSQAPDAASGKGNLGMSEKGIPGGLSGGAPAFGPGRDTGVPGWSPMSGSLRGACFSLCLCLCLSLCVSHK